jgi:hypothetical protein
MRNLILLYRGVTKSPERYKPLRADWVERDFKRAAAELIDLREQRLEMLRLGMGV